VARPAGESQLLPSSCLKPRPLVTFEHEDDNADVLVVTSGWPNADDETYCVFIKRQVESLIALGLRCDVLFIRGYRSPTAYGIAAQKLAAWSGGRRRPYRLVHAHSGEAALAAAFYRGAPLLVSYLGDDLLGTPRADGAVPLHRRLRRGAIRQHARLANHTVTKSREMERALPRTVRPRNTVQPNGVDTTLFKPIDRAAARQQLGWSASERVALFAANPDVPRKRFWLAREAVDRARSTVPDLRLEVATGVDPDRIPLLMNAVDCLLMTSSIEGSPNVVKEALMSNLPVVATPAGDVAELLEGVDPGYVCEPHIESVAAALADCLRDPRRSNGRERSAHLDSRTVAETLLRVYEQVAPELDLQRRIAAYESISRAAASDVR
jgi:glycosyltransferase involved in cell wall biosynthesis